MLFQSLMIAPFSTKLSYILHTIIFFTYSHNSLLHFFLFSFFLILSSHPYFYYTIFYSYAYKFYLPYKNVSLLHMGSIENVANSILLHVIICFGSKLVNLLLLSYIPSQWWEMAHQPCPYPVCQTWRTIQGKDFSWLKLPTNKLTKDKELSI
jgi:hypothetical protein